MRQDQSRSFMESTQLEAAREYHREREARRIAQRESEREQLVQKVRAAISRLAEQHPGVRRVYLFGSLVQPGRFRPSSDIDVAVECDNLETESAFWRALEKELERNVDVRSLTGVIAESALNEGELVYGRKDSHSSE